MAINLPIVTQFADKGIKAAQAAFANFKTDVNAASGSMNKFKAGSNAALNAVKANAGTFALAAGSAIANFAVKAVGEFQTLALESSKFADATGLSVEEASRFKEVGGDIGIGSDAIQGAIGKMNKTLGETPELFKELGVDVVKTETGLTDVNGTFLAVIDRLNGIKDPAERARVGAQLLGKGWAEMAQFVEMGSYELSQALDGVSDAKVIDAEEVKKAKEFRDTMDNLKGIIEDLSLSIGEGLIPLLTDVGELLDGLSSVGKAMEKIPGAAWARDHFGYFPVIQLGKDLFNGLGDAIGFVSRMFSNSAPKIEVYAEEMRDARIDQDMMIDSINEARGPLGKFVSGFEDAAVAMASATSQWEILTGVLDTAIALEDVQGQLAGVEAAAAKAFASGKDSDIQKYIELELKFITGLSGIANGMDNISNKEIVLAFKTDGRQAAIDLATWLSQGGEAGNLTIEEALTLAGIPGKANGGPVSGGSSYLVGERGPEIFTPSGSGMITPNSAIGGNTITINVQGADPQAVVRALQDYNRTAGPIPVNTRGN